MNMENLRTCCLKALKHGETECSVCGRKLTLQDYRVKPTTNGLKATLLIPFIALTLHSCDENNYYEKGIEKGIVKDKIENKVYLTPLDDTTTVYRIIDMGNITSRRTLENMYLNMNKGDTVHFYNLNNKTEVRASYQRKSGIIGGYHRVYNVIDINGVRIVNLPNLLRQKELEQKAKQAQLQYEKAKRSR